MTFRPVLHGFAAGLLVVGSPALALSREAPCEPARIAPEQEPLPAAWRAALEAAVAATAREGQPWSCSGGQLSLSIDEGERGAILRLRDAEGRCALRAVPSADALLPIAEALLAAPRMAAAAPDVAPATPPPALPAEAHVKPPLAPATSPAGAAREPRMLVDGLVGARSGGPLRALWGAGAVRVAVPIDAWSVGIWARAAVPYLFEPVPAAFSMFESSIGLSAGCRLLRSPIELTVTFDPSIAVTSMDAEDEDDQHEVAKVDLRLGSGLRATFHWTEYFRGVLALDAEFAPAGLAKPRRIDPSLPVLPAYGVGASIGVEAVIR